MSMTENESIDVLKNLAFLSTEQEHEKCEKAIDMAIQALEIVAKMKEHCEGSCTDCPYWNPKFDKCMNDLLKGE